MSLNMDDAFPSKWLRASDLAGRRVKVQIASVDMENFQDGTSKPALRFAGKEKGMILNLTNATTISESYGRDMLKWIGRSIELFSMKVQGPNGLVDGIRVLVDDAPPASSPGPSAPAHQEPTAPAGTNVDGSTFVDSEIPF